MSSIPQPAYPPSLADWEDHRSVITRLYVEEDRSLCDVQHILCHRYHFRSSLRSYKNRLRGWGIRKHYKTTSSRIRSPAILFGPELASLSSFGSKSRFSHIKSEDNDAAMGCCRVLSPASIDSGGTPQLSDALPVGILTPVHDGGMMVKRQPSNTTSIPNFMLKDEFSDTTNSIVMAAKAFITTAAAADVDVPTRISSEQSVKQIRPFRRRKNYIWHQFQHGLTLLEQANVPGAFDDLQRGCAMAEAYLRRPTRQVLMSLLAVMGNRRWSRHQQAWTSVVRFMASMSSKTLGPRHPLACIMNNMRSWDMMRIAAQPAMRVILDTSSRTLGPGHPEVLLLQQGLCVELMRDGAFDASEAMILEACETSAATHGPTSLARRNCLRRLGNLYVEQQRWDDAETVFETVIALDAEANNRYHGPTDETSVFTCQNLSLLNCRRGDLAKSDYWAQQELDLALKVYGPEDDYYADCLNRRSARLNGEPCDRWFSWLEVS
ncbi:hypothetical protein G647_00742 [Cladophialophora carrionii CBS 160.54]|uniref:Clr5 domain-containing protein n=1 Tax=Cladophialophora carrionii CBS 160.54 TaxID=1279043 RepID=V9DPP4_9EURO|nr:uncharacterized protein G647_00742 [Cladophialophora carrionii CBS 160.54]ETI28293.1 hypothetical protein G647_00742 [Cladophialophora carrionii CBS 160.54]